MPDAAYSCRPTVFAREVGWTLSADALQSTDGRRIAFIDIAAIRVYATPGYRLFGAVAFLPRSERCVICPREGRTLVLTSSHYRRVGRIEDRSANFRPFVAELLHRVAVASPGAVPVIGMPRPLWWAWSGLLALNALVCVFLAACVIVAARTVGPVSFEALIFALAFLATGYSAEAILKLLERERTRDASLIARSRTSAG